MTDETRDRPQEIDFGPGSLDHRIGRWPHCPDIYATPQEGLMPDPNDIRPRPAPPKKQETDATQDALNILSEQVTKEQQEQFSPDLDNALSKKRIEEAAQSLKSTPPPSDKGDGDIQTTAPLESTGDIVASSLGVNADLVDTEGNELTAWQAQTSPDKFLIKAKRIVIEYMNTTGQSNRRMKPKELTIVWFSRTLQNWKALVSTVHKDGLYFEVTYNGHAGETYIDVYQKVTNLVIED